MGMPPLVDALFAVLESSLVRTDTMKTYAHLMTTRCQNTNLNGFLTDDAVGTLALLILRTQIRQVIMFCFEGIHAFQIFLTSIIKYLESSVVELVIELFFVCRDRVRDMLELPVVF